MRIRNRTKMETPDVRRCKRPLDQERRQSTRLCLRADGLSSLGLSADLHEGGRAYFACRSHCPSYRVVAAACRHRASGAWTHAGYQGRAALSAHARHGNDDCGTDHRELGHLCLGDRRRPFARCGDGLFHQSALQHLPRRRAPERKTAAVADCCDLPCRPCGRRARLRQRRHSLGG